MKKIVIIFSLFMWACTQTTEIETFDCSGVWVASRGQDIIQLFILQKDYSITGDVYLNFNYIGSFSDGKIIGNEKYFTFSYEQETLYGRAKMGFQGRFQNDELIGLISGRVFITQGYLFVFENEKYKFTKVPMYY